MSDKTNATLGEVSAAYNGAIGKIWELLMGEFIHIGGLDQTKVLAKKAKIKKGNYVLDICSALGGPARFLAKKYGCRVMGLDGTAGMHEQAVKRTKKARLDKLVQFRIGSALDIPFPDETFDVVWGEDAWCYVRDKERLISEVARVLKKGGTLAFTDWLKAEKSPVKTVRRINEFMVFPDVQTLDGYAKLCEKSGLGVVAKENLFAPFAGYVAGYLKQAGGPLRKKIVSLVGAKVFDQLAAEMVHLHDAACCGWFGRGRIIAKKRTR